MENTEGLIRAFLAGTMKKKKYTDADEFAKDLAEVLFISKDKLVVELINLPDLIGPEGPKGDRGAKGERGDTGLQGNTGPAGPSVTWVGPWADATAYVANDLVSHGGDVYIAKAGHLSDLADNEPGVGANWTTYWDIYTTASGAIVSGFVNLLDGATVTWPKVAGIVHQNAKVTITANRTLDLTGWANGDRGTIIVSQDGIGGHTLALPANSLVAGGGAGAITLSAGANDIDVLHVWYDGTDFYWNYDLDYT